MHWQIELRKGKTVLGLLTIDEVDQPWFIGQFEARSEFDNYKQYFDTLNQLEEEAGSDEFCDAEEAIQALGLELVSLNEKFSDGSDRISDFMLFIEDDEVRFRY